MYQLNIVAQATKYNTSECFVAYCGKHSVATDRRGVGLLLFLYQDLWRIHSIHRVPFTHTRH